MKRTRNVGTVDAFVRITLGVTALTWVLRGRGGRWANLIALLGAMTVAEGITRYSPWLSALNTTTLERLGRWATPGRNHEERGELPDPTLSTANGYGNGAPDW